MFEAYSHSNHEGLIAASCIEKEVRFGSSTGLEARKPDVRFIRTSRHYCNPITNWSAHVD